jgi:glycosyltransferase involved in cell wall biosynthesis
MNMSSLPLVTISMPAFNCEKYIAEAIESVLSQTYTNFELIIMDDGSTDGTREIINRYADSRIVKVFFDTNSGLIGTRNKIVNLARGKYLALLDADDRAFPERLASQVKFLEEGNADICGADHWTLNQDNGLIKPSKQRHSNSDIRALLTVCSPICNPAIMGKMEIFKRFPYKKSYLHAEDYCSWVEIALAGYKFANLRDKLIIYRLHSNQTSVNHLDAAKSSFASSQLRYLENLGISACYFPRPLPFLKRLYLASMFILRVNRNIKRISVGANCELYARFQYRGNGLWTPLTRAERFLIALSGSLIGRLGS